MWKKYNTTALVVTILLLGSASTSWSHKPLLMAGITISPKYPLMYGKPFHVNIHANVGPKAESATLDLKLSDGLQLIKGDLQVTEGEEWKDPFGEDVIIQINEPGTYELAVTCRISFKKDDPSRVLTRTYSQFFYAREDTIIRFSSHSEMEQAIRDSLVYPGVATRRYYARHQINRDSLRLVEEAKHKQPQTFIADSLKHFFENPVLVADTIQDYHLTDHYTDEQIKLIHQYHLYYSPPRLEFIELALRSGTWEGYTPEQRENYIRITKQHFMERYEYDQRLLHTANRDSMNFLIGKRMGLIMQQAKEIHAMLHPESPATH